MGAANATSLFSSGIYLISAGSSDFVQNYYVNPLLHNTYTPEQFINILMQNYEKFIEVSLKLSTKYAISFNIQNKVEINIGPLLF